MNILRGDISDTYWLLSNNSTADCRQSCICSVKIFI